ncbi:MAG: hypothetical protein WC371_05715 [Parachlamydiales bacterium]|jgi:hypothetical protein
MAQKFILTGAGALLGGSGAYLINHFQKATIVHPLNGALCLAGIASLEKVTSFFTKNIVQTMFFVMLKIRNPKVVQGICKGISYGLATHATLKIMQLAGLILAVPQAVSLIGGLCLGISIASGIYTLYVGAQLLCAIEQGVQAINRERK